MPDSLSEATWNGFTKKNKLDVEDKALLKALAKFDKTDAAKPEPRLQALKELVEQLDKQLGALVKLKKALGDKPFALAKDQLHELRELAEDEQKKAQATLQASDSDDEPDTPALLTTKMVPLLRELRKGQVSMHALICTAGKETSVLIMRRAIAPTRRKLLAQAVGATGGMKYYGAECVFENKMLTFVVKAQVARMAKRLRQALLDQTELRFKVKVRGEDGVEEEDGEDGGDEDNAGGAPGVSGTSADMPPQPAAKPPAPPGGLASKEQIAFVQRLRQLRERYDQALRDQHPEATKLRTLMGFASEKAAAKEFTAALQALEALQKALDAAATPTADTEAKPKPAGAYARMKDRLKTQFESARKRNNILAKKIDNGVKAADALSTGGDEAAALTRLRALVQEVEDVLASDRQELEQRLEVLYDKATQIRLDLKPDADTVRSTVRATLRSWDLDTARAALNDFERAIEKAKPLDFEDLHVVQKRRAEQFRKENAEFAANTEQALLAARRIVDDNGELVLDGGLLKGLPFVRTDDLAAVAEGIAGTKDAALPQSVHALQMLKRLQQDKAAQEALKKVKAPPDPSTVTTGTPAEIEEAKQSLRAAQALIRNTLGLPDDAKITDVEARRAAMAALLAQVRQVDVGSCFATASAVRVQRNKPEQFLADMTEMLSTGKLTRVIESPPGTQLTIQVPISRDMVGRKVDVTRKDTNLHLKPNMIAGLDALGIDEADQKTAIEDAARRLRAERALDKALAKIAAFLPPTSNVADLKKAALEAIDGTPTMTIEAALRAPLSKIVLSTKTAAGAQRSESNARKKLALDCTKQFDDVNGADDFTPQELIEQIGKSRPGGALPAERVAAAKTAFDTSHDNTLTRAWEYTIATMMEKRPDGSTNGRTLAGGIGDALESALGATVQQYATDNGLSADDADNDKLTASWVSGEIADRLSEGLEARYDPGVASLSGATARDGASSGGGYSLFFRGKKIDGQAEFEAAVKQLMDESKAFFEANTENWDAQDVARAKAMIDELKEKVETNAFRASVIEAQAKRAVTVVPGSADYAKKVAEAKDKFARPWTVTGGGGDTTIMQLYENQPRRLSTESSANFRYKVGNVDTPVTNAEGLTHFLMSTFAKMGVGASLPDGDASERASVPVGNPIHAFTLKPGSPALVTALKQGKTPAAFVDDFKSVEGEKNAKRRNAQLPVTDLSRGLVAEMIKASVSIFKEATRAAKIAEINSRIEALKVETISLSALKALLKQSARGYMDAEYPSMVAAKREEWANKSVDRAVTPERVLAGVIPKEEYGALVDASLRKLRIEGPAVETIRKAVLEALKKKDAVVREDLAKEIRIAMRELGLGVSDQDTANARKAYAALADGPQRVAALKAAGKEVKSPAADFDKLKDDERAALVEHGLGQRLEAQLDSALIAPRGLVFADPNWGSGDHMTVFSMVVNPLSDPPTMEMWQMKEDGSAAQKMDQTKWIANGAWWVFADPTQYGGAMNNHEIVTPAGKKSWEVYRAELRSKLDECYTARKGDLPKMQRILDIADQRFAAAEFEAADKALLKLAEELAPLAKLATGVAKGIKSIERLSAEVKKQAAVAEAKKAAAVLDALILELRSRVQTPDELKKFVAERKDVLEYIDRESPFGATGLVQSLTLA